MTLAYLPFQRRFVGGSVSRWKYPVAFVGLFVGPLVVSALWALVLSFFGLPPALPPIRDHPFI